MSELVMALDSRSQIPVLDFSAIRLFQLSHREAANQVPSELDLSVASVCTPSTSSPEHDCTSGSSAIQLVAADLVKAFEEVGFVYISNHGISIEKIEQMFQLSAKFFQLPEKLKCSFIVPLKENTPPFGYEAPGAERFFEDRPADIKEAFDCTNVSGLEVWPDDKQCQRFRSSALELMTELKDFSDKILALIGLGLNLKDPYFFVKTREVCRDDVLRLLHYPVIASLSGNPRPAFSAALGINDLEPGQVRCQEHTDYGLITLLFQDNCGGLEVMNRAGQYVEAKPIPNTVVVNIADFLSMCTGNRLKSTMHRVVIPEANFSRSRYSMAYFCEPDGEVETVPLFGSDESHQPVSYNEWRTKRFRETQLIAHRPT